MLGDVKETRPKHAKTPTFGEMNKRRFLPLSALQLSFSEAPGTVLPLDVYHFTMSKQWLRVTHPRILSRVFLIPMHQANIY